MNQSKSSQGPANAIVKIAKIQIEHLFFDQCHRC